MGYDASWTPTVGGPTQNARVLFHNPTENRTIDTQAEYEPYRFEMEYFADYFTGLKNSVDASGKEVVTVNDVDYNVRKVIAKSDGKQFVATLEPVSA